MSLAKLIHGLTTKFHEKFSGLFYGDLYFLIEAFLPLTSEHLIPIAPTFTPFSQKFYILNSLKWHHTPHSHRSSKPGYHRQPCAFRFRILSTTLAIAPLLGAGHLPLLPLPTAWRRVWSLQHHSSRDRRKAFIISLIPILIPSHLSSVMHSNMELNSSIVWFPSVFPSSTITAPYSLLVHPASSNCQLLVTSCNWPCTYQVGL